MTIDKRLKICYNIITESEVDNMSEKVNLILEKVIAILKKMVVIFAILLCAGAIQNPNSLYVATDFEMIAIDENHLQNSKGEVYEYSGKLRTGETYTVKLEFHPDRIDVVKCVRK